MTWESALNQAESFSDSSFIISNDKLNIAENAKKREEMKTICISVAEL